jgi:hypothetical protein
MKRELKQMKDTASVAMFRVIDFAKKWRSKQQPEIKMLPLTPRYIKEEHGVYLNIIEDALKTKGDTNYPIRNIALSGGYGAGKSSILEEIRRRHKKSVLLISLATLNYHNNATTFKNRKESTTNLIQKEIIKQIIYSEHPDKMPGSQYRRVSKARFGRMLYTAVLIAPVATTVFYLTGWTKSLSDLIPKDLMSNISTPYIPSALMLVIFFVLTILSLYLLHNRLHIDKLSAGNAAIALSSRSATYFDEYLDEIVYFFEISKKINIVIFEDIDRFNDDTIFETLRSLNTVLNAAKQLKSRNIRFIYAIRDSIFETSKNRNITPSLPTSQNPDSINNTVMELDNLEAEEANRTKFFDLIVPVVPFVTYVNARDLIDNSLKDINNQGVSTDLIDLLGRHIPDMRLIKNIRNEFIVFRDRVIKPNSLELTDDKLFAMIAYKNTRLADFERIRLGTSKVDSIYRVYRDIINYTNLKLNGEINGYKNELKLLTPKKGHGEVFGTKVIDDVSRNMRHMQGTNMSYRYQGSSISDSEMLTDDFWDKIATDKGSINISYRSPGYGIKSYELTFDELKGVVNDPLDADIWQKEQMQRIEGLIEEANKDLGILASADMKDLMEHSRFTYNERSLKDAVKEEFKSDLAIELVRNGYIDRNYTLYTSIFHGNRVSANATNFIMKNVDAHVIDISFQLNSADAQAVLRERPDVIYQKASYNISLLEYLLRKEPKNANHVIAQLISHGDDERDFIYSYLTLSNNKEKIIEALVVQWPGIFKMLLAKDTPLSDENRIRFMNVALQYAQGSINYTIDNDFRNYLEASYKDLEILTSTKTTANQVSTLSELLNKSGVEFDDLKPLSIAVRRAVVGIEAYKINRSNLLLALDNPSHSLSINDIKDTDDIVYNHTLDDVPAYLKTLDENNEAITSQDQFGTIITDILSSSEASLETIIKRTAPLCSIENISEVSDSMWQLLAKYHRFHIKFNNVSAYVNKYGIDENISSSLIETGSIAVSDDDDEEAKSVLAKILLESIDVLPAAKLRVDLVNSLELKNYMSDDSIPRESGELVGLLLEKDIAEDNRATFAHLDADDIDGLAFAISKSTEFVNFMTTTEVTPTNVGRIVNHILVPTNVKDVIIARYNEFTANADVEELYLVAAYALESNKQLELDMIQRLATNKINPQFVIKLLKQHLPTITLADIMPILTAFGGNYCKLIERNGLHPIFINDEAHQALAKRLIELGTASSITEKGANIKVNMHHL